ncbi:MAG: ATP-binding protein [Ignavibacteriaceae bacterium]
MKKIKIFISSVQTEFSNERHMLNEYISTDALLGRFFEPFIFETLPANDRKSDAAYLEKIKHSEIYLGIFGKEYGSADKKGISPTEKEFDFACTENKTRLIFISNHKSNERNSKELSLIRKAENEVVRKKFSSPSELKTAVYASLVNYLEDKEYLRTGPFDASICKNAYLNDLDSEKISQFVLLAKSKRGFPLPSTSSPEKILTHLNLLNDDKLTNAAVLLFGKEPQRFFITSEVKCAQFYGNDIVKPIPAYQVYKGDVFQLVDQSVDFVLSRVNARVGTRNKSVDAPFDYEIPRAAVAEAIVNAVAHRDYTSNASIQVMLFRDRLEIWNPGQLPDKLTLSKLKLPHSSFPANPLLAEPMYLAGYIERLGTGIPDMIELCKSAGLKEPDFKIEDVFKIIIYRSEETGGQVAPQVTGEAGGEAGGEVTEEVRRVVLALGDEMKRADIQKILQLKHDDFFRVNYIIPSLNSGYVEMKYPNNPNHPNQRYRLSAKGKRLKTKLKKELEKK